jgi:hypothetical protein
MPTRYFTARFSGTKNVSGPGSGLEYLFYPGCITPVNDPRDADVFLLMGTPEAGNYLFREVDASGTPIGRFPPVNPLNRQSMINPKRFPSDKMGVTVREWREMTEDYADPTLFFHKSRVKLNFGGGGDRTI